MLHSPVVLCMESAAQLRLAEECLAEAGIGSLPVMRPEDLEKLPGALDVFVAGSGIATSMAIRYRLLSGSDRGQWPVHVVVVGEPSGETAPLPLPWRSCPCVHHLPQVVIKLRMDEWRRRVVGRVRRAAHLPFVVREALVAVVAQEFPDTSDGAEIIHTITRAARKIGVRREHLGRAANKAGVDLQHFNDSLWSVRLIAARELEKRPWLALAVEMGFQGQSAVIALLRRGMGATPTEAVGRRSIEEWLQWWEEAVLDPLLEEDHVG